MNALIRPRTQMLQRTWSSPPKRRTELSAALRDGIDAIAQFSAMEAAYAPHGGMLRADELAQRMRGEWEQPISTLAEWIVSRAVISLEWRSDILIPAFQVDPCSGCIRPGCRAIVAELRDVMGNWEMARWFAASDPWLGGLAPVDMLSVSSREVFNAARVARFVARG